jgi:hypothetical protein
MKEEIGGRLAVVTIAVCPSCICAKHGCRTSISVILLYFMHIIVPFPLVSSKPSSTRTRSESLSFAGTLLVIIIAKLFIVQCVVG